MHSKFIQRLIANGYPVPHELDASFSETQGSEDCRSRAQDWKSSGRGLAKTCLKGQPRPEAHELQVSSSLRVSTRAVQPHCLLNAQFYFTRCAPLRSLVLVTLSRPGLCARILVLSTYISQPAAKMRDPFPFSPPPQFIQDAVRPLAEYLNMATLPLHIHEIVFAIALYSFINSVVSPWLSMLLCPQTYSRLDARTRISWNVHVVSLFQSVLICALALWVTFADKERANMDWEERIWGYTGAVGLITSMACGYFIWDLVVTAKRVDIFGVGMLFHAISATAVFSLGFVSQKFPWVDRRSSCQCSKACGRFVCSREILRISEMKNKRLHDFPLGTNFSRSAPLSTTTPPSLSSMSSLPHSTTSTGSSTSST